MLIGYLLSLISNSSVSLSLFSNLLSILINLFSYEVGCFKSLIIELFFHVIVSSFIVFMNSNEQ
jgi:hypothetical protein